MRIHFPSKNELLRHFSSHSPAKLTFIIIIILDQITKYLVLAKISVGESIPIIQGIFHLTSVQNTGIAFGLFKNANMLFTISAILIVGLVLYYLAQVKANEKMLQICLGMLLGGAIGNLIDRISLGFVVDFLDFRIWPVFNVADSAITLSIIGLFFLLWKK